MRTKMSDALVVAATLACDRLADVGAGACALFLRKADPDGAWPVRSDAFREHAQDIAREGIMGDGPEACACFALALVCTADPDALCQFAREFDIDDTSGVTDRLIEEVIETLSVGLADGMCSPESAAFDLRSAR